MPSHVPVQVRNTAAPQAWPGAGYFSSLYDGFDRMLDGLGRTWATVSANGDGLIRMDCAETGEGLELTAEIPGLKDKDVQVVLSDGMLTISGEKRAEHEHKHDGYRFVERTYGAFSRSVELPRDVDAAKIEATIADGVLKVVAPRRPKTEPKTIEIKPRA